ncbi:hypothetical protein J3R75_002033 [Oligosphaera ethanolica]|uniref:Uncharacterized protein n=1 Tax=Oligosphaera ethanolica TaxID=760260 RepID=A0AAE3VGN6_9BACT|nr:hypothetical protein [Oligosphaera ethanolica]
MRTVLPCGRTACRAATSSGGPGGGRAVFISREGAKARRRLFFRRFRRLSQILAACLAALRQSTPPVIRRESVGGGPGGARCFFLTRRREGAKKTFFPQIPQIIADFGGRSCRFAAIHAAGKKARRVEADLGGGRCFYLTRRREGAKKTFFPQIPQIIADFGGLSCRFAAIHAAGNKARRVEADLGGGRCFYLTRRREEDFFSADSADYRRFWRPVLPLCGNPRRR